MTSSSSQDYSKTGAWRWMFVMDVQELCASRSYWLMLLAISALVGQTFIAAVEFYAEASGAGGGPAALAQGLSPLEGMLVPTLGAYDLAATLLFPFVVIRLFSHEKQTGAHWLTLQSPVNFGATILSKGLTLFAAWIVALIPGLSALVVWSQMGGHLFVPETAGILLGYLLRGAFTIGVGAAASAVSASASSAAVVALAFTIGTWALDYLAAARGGMVEQIASYTPWAALRTFERGELRLSTILVLLVACAGGLAVNAMAAPSGRTRQSRILRTAAVAIFAALTGFLCSRVSASADVSENRRNSFTVEDEQALRALTAPLRITVYLTPEDPRLVDLEHGVFLKLRRAVRDVRLTYAASGRSELFQQPGQHYGEVWYALPGKQLMTRSSTEEVVLETVYELMGRPAPVHAAAAPYAGYPLRAHSLAAPWLFFLCWPLLISMAWFAIRHRRTPVAQTGELL